MTKTCIDCGVEKATEQFPINYGKYRRTRCQPCYTVYNTRVKRNGYDLNRERDIQLRKKYGISLDQYLTMLDEQNGVCKICDQPETRRRNGEDISMLAVDHDHETNRVRGLLCYRCNLMLGYAGDNTETLKRAIEYLGGNE